MGGAIKLYYKGYEYKQLWSIRAIFAMNYNCQMELLRYFESCSSFQAQFKLTELLNMRRIPLSDTYTAHT